HPVRSHWGGIVLKTSQRRSSLAMANKLISALTAAGVVGVVYAGTQYYLGTQVAREIAALEQTLIAANEIQVRHFEYDRGFASGTLHYDLSVMPTSDPSLVEGIFAPYLSFLPQEGFPF